VTIHVRERKLSAPGGLARLAIEDDSRFAEELRVYTSDEDLARAVLSSEVQGALKRVDEYDRYEFLVEGGEVLARCSFVDQDPELLVRAMHAVSALAARSRELVAQWAELAHAVGGQRPEPARWRLAASDPIIATRNGVTVTIRAHVASPGAAIEARLYTEYSCALESPIAPFVLYTRDWDGPLRARAARAVVLVRARRPLCRHGRIPAQPPHGRVCAALPLCHGARRIPGLPRPHPRLAGRATDRLQRRERRADHAVHVLYLSGASPYSPRIIHERIAAVAGPEHEDAMLSAYDQLIEKGVTKGQRVTLLRQLGRRFGALPEPIATRVAAAPPADVERWLDRVIDAATLDDVFDGD
jgi:hypothetical protein